MSRAARNFITFLIVIAAGLLVYFGPFYGVDSNITDTLYTKFDGTDRRIVIIGIDEETLAEYGNFNLWSREKLAELLEKLYEDPNNKPAVVGLDLILSESYDDEVDQRLADAAAKADGDIVIGSNLVYRGRLEVSRGGELYYNTEHIENVEFPYPALREVSVAGFTNKCIASDGYIRYAMNSVRYHDSSTGENTIQDSFAYAIYKLYAKKSGEEIKTPKTNSRNQFQFRYSGETGEFSKLSLAAVLSGKIPASAFKDAIVLVGAYAPGFQDAYQPASDRGDSMYGVEIHANILQAYMQGKTMVVANKTIMAIITAILALIIMLAGRKLRLIVFVIGSTLFAVLYLLAGVLLAGNGLVIPCIYMILVVIVADLFFLVDEHQRELKKQMWSFTEAMATAVDERTPYNATHSRNVAKYSGMVADHINKLHRRFKEKEHFSEKRKEQLVMGALLHDIGKVAVPLSVMNKGTRLDGREEDIKKRFETFRFKAENSLLKGEKDEKWYKDVVSKTDQAEILVEKVNPAGYLDDKTREELETVMKYSFEGEPFFTDEEKECLAIVKGTLTDSERETMESHVTITKHILDKVYFNRYFKKSPLYASQHHELLNGKGYPNGITGDELSPETRIMTVCDVCDALLATDRPYKKPLPFEKAFAILRDMAEKGEIDGKYVEYLYECLKPQYADSAAAEDK